MARDEWFSDQVAIAHYQGRIPRGRTLPDGMPFIGDFYVTENEDGTDTMWAWFGHGQWDKGPNLVRPKELSHEK
jgi:hypothetical protein